MLRTPELDLHVQLSPAGAPAVAAHLAFRDRLRADAGDRGRYAATKRRLAEQQWATMNHYAEAKTEVIETILARAAPGSGTGPRRAEEPAEDAASTPPPM